MKKLPIKIQRIIKKKIFKLDTVDRECSWRGGLKISYRITMVKSDDEDHTVNTPINNNWSPVTVNIKVKGQVETRTNRNSHKKTLRDISKVTKTKLSYWGGYESLEYDYVWGRQANKKVRKEIRCKAKNDVVNFLKLMGIQTERWSDGLSIGAITWEK